MLRKTQLMRVSGLVGTLAALMFVSPRAAQAQTWIGQLLGTNESPPNASPAKGFVTISFNSISHNLNVMLNWSGLVGGNPTAAHIHCCVAPGSNIGVAVGLTGFPATTSGSYSGNFDLTNPAVYTTAFRTNFGGGTAAGAETALINGLNAGNAFANIHNAQYPGGEIRANVTVTPEPSSVLLMAVGLGGVIAVAIRRRDTAV